MAPLTPRISTVLPAASRPCHWKSCAPAGTARTRMAAAAAQDVRVLMRPPRPLRCRPPPKGWKTAAVVLEWAAMAEPVDVERAMDTARHAAMAASAASLRYWRKDVKVDLKPDRTPVTAADRDAEAAILEVIRVAFPGHAILAEESGAQPGEGGR